MKKKRLVYPDKLRPWIDARSQYKLNHAHIEMARELGLDPKNFAGIVKHLEEHTKQPLAEFIEVSYRERFGKDVPEDRRSIEQKLKAEDEKKQEKRMVKAQTKAAAKWEALPLSVRTTVLESVWCNQCMKISPITEFECQTMNDGLIVNGKCAVCGTAVGRYVEGE